MCFTLPGANQKSADPTPPTGDFFCSHHVQTRDGDIAFFGGTMYLDDQPPPPPPAFEGSKLVYVWTPSTTTGSGWTRYTDLGQPRYYPTVTVGEIYTDGRDRYYVTGGLDLAASYPSMPSTYESYQRVVQGSQVSLAPDFHGTGRIYTGPLQVPPPNESGTFYWYPHIFLLTTGDFFMASFALNSGKAHHNPLVANPGWSYLFGTWPAQGYYLHYGSSVPLPIDLSNPSQSANQFVRIGGGLTYGPKENDPNRVPQGYPQDPVASDAIHYVNLNPGQPPGWQSLSGLTTRRVHCNAVILADGKILVLGGSSSYTPRTLNADSEIVDIIANTRIKTPAMDPRGYHASAILLSDGRVLYGGGTGSGNARISDYQIYSPPYLFKGPRPAITSINTSLIRYGLGGQGEYSLTFSYDPDNEDAFDYVSKVVLIRPGSSTHHFDSEQRYLQLELVSTPPPPPGTLQFKAPPSGNHAPPGWYMIVIVTTTGIPSVAGWVQVTP